MVSDIVRYIEQVRKIGKSYDEIKSSLKQKGHEDSVIGKSIKIVKQRKILLFMGNILLLFIIIILVFFILNLFSPKENVALNETNKTIDQIERESKTVIWDEDEERFNEILNLGDLSLCKELKDENLYNRCLRYLNRTEFIKIDTSDEKLFEEALDTHNEELCNKIEDQNMKDRCLSTFVVQKVDEDIVEKENNDQDFYNEALDNWDVIYCDSIQDSLLKKQCEMEFD